MQTKKTTAKPKTAEERFFEREYKKLGKQARKQLDDGLLANILAFFKANALNSDHNLFIHLRSEPGGSLHLETQFIHPDTAKGDDYEGSEDYLCEALDNAFMDFMDTIEDYKPAKKKAKGKR